MTDYAASRALAPEQLRWHLPPDELPYETTADLEPIEEIIGQDTAVNAIRLGLELQSFGYNIFITGLVGTGRQTVVQRLLSELSSEQGIDVRDRLCDLAYVHSFTEPDQPRLLRLPAGRGSELARAMEQLVHALRVQVPKIFDSDAYGEQRKTLLKTFRERQSTLIEGFEKKVEAEGFAVVQVQMGPITRPDVSPTIEGEPVDFDRLNELVEEGKLEGDQVEELKEKHKVLSEELAEVAKEMRGIEKNVNERLAALNRDIVGEAVADFFRDLRARFEFEGVRAYLDEVERDILEKADRFGPSDEEEEEAEVDPLHFYGVNLVVDNGRRQRVPVIIETHPSHRSLFGTVEGPVDREHITRADYSNLRAGSLLRGDGGYIILNALDVMNEPGVWPALKRTLRTGKVQIEPTEVAPFQWGTALKPEPVMVRTKVVMIGDARIHGLLYQMDEDFRKIFKVKAEFDAVMPRTDQAINQYGRFVAMMCRSESLPPFSRAAVARLVEYGVRHSGNREKLSTHFTYVKDVIVEGAYWARKAGAELVERGHVDEALKCQRARVSLAEKHLLEAIERGQIIIDTEGEVTGQVNGLAVYNLGDHAFGLPARITASVGVGRAGIINIEREVALSGETHDKGVLILNGFMRDRFARETPLALSASVAFEQSYGGIDGDSASSTEIYALLSALSGHPIRQDFAVTGSMSQRGEIQPIGGVNEKVEGFFDVCRLRGLTGTQGVVIPRRNVEQIMLREDVVEAVREGRFRVVAVDSIDEGVEVLTGVAAGKRGPDGEFPPDSVNGAVQRRLRELADLGRPYGAALPDREG